MHSSPTPGVFLDFDGTITIGDATDAILEAFADREWLRIEEDWQAGRIGSRECLAAQMALVTATTADVDELLDGIAVDPGFPKLLDVCDRHAVPVHILSDGFDYCIQRILGRPALGLAARLASVRIVSSHLEPRGGRWHASFNADADCVHGCATCKPSAMARLHRIGPAIFVGDGLSDRHAAAHADIVFAKDKLEAYCKANARPYIRYNELSAVGAWVESGERLFPIS